jgi:4-azaleucine resistance transporter AzlC
LIEQTEPVGGWRHGFRVGIGLGAGVFVLAVSFGDFAVRHHWPAWLTVVMSLVVFSGSAQFAVVTSLAGGGGLGPALVSASLVNLRFVPMATSAARDLKGGRWRRALEGQAVVDGSWLAAQRGDGTLDRRVMIAASLVQWPAWVAGTALGALVLPSPHTTYAAGLDLVFPAFFIMLLLDTLMARPPMAIVAGCAVGIATVACVFLPVGVALLFASLAGFIPLRNSSEALPPP